MSKLRLTAGIIYICFLLCVNFFTPLGFIGYFLNVRPTPMRGTGGAGFVGAALFFLTLQIFAVYNTLFSKQPVAGNGTRASFTFKEFAYLAALVTVPVVHSRISSRGHLNGVLYPAA